MKAQVKETENEYKLIKEKPYKELVNKDTLISVGVFFLFLIIIKLYIVIPVIIFFVALASVQTIEQNLIVTINKKTKEFTITRYYMGKWHYKTLKYKASDFVAVQVEKQVTTMKEDGRFTINLLTEPPDSTKKGITLPLMDNLDLEDIEQAKIISYFLDLLYDSRIKYKVELK
ncbi:MAG: hypothetical protein U0354_11955 [Candidatus Sericytochromatia bacterium]